MCTVALTVASALGQVWQGYTAKQAADAQAAAAEQNARISEARAHDAVTRGGIKEAGMRRALRRMLGTQSTNAAAAGISSNSGSLSDARLSSIDAMERDIDVNEMNAQRERWGHQVQAVNYENQASAARASGKNAMTAGILGGVATLGTLVAPKVDEWFSKGVGGGLYTEHATAGLNASQQAGNLTSSAADIFPQSEFAKYGYTPFDPSSFGAGAVGFSKGKAVRKMPVWGAF